MVLSKTILILEDNLLVLSKLLEKLFELENEIEYDLSVIVLTNSQQVEDCINSNPNDSFDIALIDRDCKVNGSFHVLDFDRFDISKIIAISSIPEYNEQLKEKGVKTVVLKDLQDIDKFSQEAVSQVSKLLILKRLLNILSTFERKERVLD